MCALQQAHGEVCTVALLQPAGTYMQHQCVDTVSFFYTGCITLVRLLTCRGWQRLCACYPPHHSMHLQEQDVGVRRCCILFYLIVLKLSLSTTVTACRDGMP